MRGIIDKCKEANVAVDGGQTINNPWWIVGGTGITNVDTNSQIKNKTFLLNDVLVLTKPLSSGISIKLVDHETYSENKE